MRSRSAPGRSKACSLSPLDEDAGPEAQRWLFAALARLAMPVWGAAAGEGRDLLERIGAYWCAQAQTRRQYTGVLSTARTACAELASPRLATTLYFGCEPGWRAAARAHVVDFARLASPGADGRLLPLTSPGATASTRCSPWR